MMTASIRILYVDDEPSLLDIGKLFLEQSGDFTVTTALSAADAIRLLEQEKFDAIISDYQMPEMDGIQFLAEVRKRFGPIPFILFTGRGREEVVIQALNSGADFYLQKGGEPAAQFAELLHKVRQAVQQRHSVAKIRDHERREAEIINFLPDATFAIDTDGLVIAWNRAMEVMTGVRASEILGKGNYEYSIPVYNERRPILIDLILHDDPSIAAKYPSMKRDGGTLVAEATSPYLYKGRGATIWFTAAPLYNNQGEVVGAIESIRDISDRKRVEEEITSKNLILSTQQETSLDAILIVDNCGKILQYNRKFIEIWKIPDDIIASRNDEPVLQFVVQQNIDPEVFLSRVRYLYNHTEEKSFEELLLKDGRILERFSAPMLGEKGKYYGRVWYFRDISDRKKAEAALQHQSASILILNAIITTANKADNLPQLLENILTDSLRLLDFDAGGIYLVDRTTRTANIVHSKNLPEEFLAEIQTTPIDKKPYDTLFIKNEPIITENYAKISPNYSKKYGFQSIASIPLLSKGVAIGALNLTSMRRHVISDEEKQTLISICTELGSTIERMGAEEKAKNASKNLETLFNSIDEMVFVLDMQGHILVVNNTVLKRLSYSSEELNGTDVLLLHVPEQRDEALRNIQGMIAGTIDSCPVPVLAKDGTRIEVETKVTRGLWNGSEVLIGVTRDITKSKLAEDEIATLKKQIEFILGATKTGIDIIDAEFNIKYIDPEWQKVYGDPSGRKCYEYFMGKKCICHGCGIPKALETKQPFISEEVLPKENNRVVQVTSIPYMNQTGEWLVAEINVDITELKQKEKAFKAADREIRQSKDMFRAFLDHSYDAVMIHDTGGKLLDVNATMLRLYRVTREEALRYTIADYTGPANTMDEAHEHWARALAGEDQLFFWQARRPNDGSVFDVEVYLTSITIDDHQIILGNTRDITERRLAEETLKTNQIRFAEAMDLAHMVNWEFDATTGIFTFNDRFYALYGTTAELEGGNQMPADVYAKKFVHPDDQHLVAVEVNKAIEASDPGYMSLVEHRIIRRDGEIRHIVVRFGITKDENGRTIRTHGANQDITDRKRVEVALQHLTEFQKSIITNARVWLSVLDPKGKILIWNTAAEEISGYLSEEVIGHNEIWKKIYPDKEYRKQITDTINRIIRDKNYLENFETTILSKGGTKKVISWNTRGIPDATGSVSDYIAIGVDVTDRIQAEELRHESERRMTDIISFLPDATLVIDKNGIVLAWNRAMEEMTGVPAEQMIGKGNYEYALPFYHERRPITVDLVLHDDPAVVAKYPFMQKEGRSRRSELFIPHLNKGRGAHLWFTASPLYDADGNLTGAIESIRDITERKQAEEAIQKNKETYRELVESISDVIFEIDCDGKITYISPVVQKVLEFKPEEMIGKKFIQFIYPDDRDLLNRKFSNLSKGMEHPSDYRVTTKSGNVRWVRTQSKPVMIEKKFCGARGTLIDITLRKQSEGELRQANKKLNLLSGITRHDINNQMTVLMGYLTIIKKKQTDPAFNEYFVKVSSAAQRISAMIQFTKEYESIGVTAPVWQDCSIVVDTAAKQAQLGQVIIKNDLPSGAEIFADPLIVKVFYNLMDNAVRYGGKITTIRFSDEEHDGDHVVVCEDDGDGVVEQEKEKIFERGFGKNTGLGLTLSREILDITGITISETGEPGKGARFEITVPKGAWRMTGKGD